MLPQPAPEMQDSWGTHSGELHEPSKQRLVIQPRPLPSPPSHLIGRTSTTRHCDWPSATPGLLQPDRRGLVGVRHGGLGA